MRVLFAPALVALIAATAFAGEPQVRTNRQGARILPLPKERGVYHFIIFGDRTGGPREGLDVLRHAIKDTNLLDPDLVMTVGDLIEGYNPREPWLTEMQEYKEIMKGLRMPWYPVAGNHDVYWRGSPAPQGEHEGDYEEHFGPLWYWFPHKKSAFVVLFTDEGDPATGRKGFGRPEFNKFSDAQLEWLGKTLAETAFYTHVFLFLHHPRWIDDFYPANNWERVHKLLTDAGNVSAVFAGHIHRQRYEGKRDGIEYFTLSTTGGGMPFDSPGSGYLNHFNVVTVRDEGVSVTTIPVGAVLDPKTMTPEHLADIDKARRLPVEVEGGPLLVQKDGSTQGKLVYSIRNPASRALDVTMVCRSKGEDWWLGPDHSHFRLEPNATKAVSVVMAREGDEFKGAFTLPEVALTVAYLTEARRIGLGEQIRPVAVRPTLLPESALAAGENRTLVLDGKASCVTAPASSFSIPDGPFTVEAWVAPEADGTTGIIAGNFDFLLYLLGGRPVFGLD
ncbi:MAG: metallophosphoesterase family protein, partial [Planctomycetota bacterium]